MKTYIYADKDYGKMSLDEPRGSSFVFLFDLVRIFFPVAVKQSLFPGSALQLFLLFKF